MLQDASQYDLDLAASQPPPASQPAPDGDAEDEDEEDSVQVTSMMLHAPPSLGIGSDLRVAGRSVDGQCPPG